MHFESIKFYLKEKKNKLESTAVEIVVETTQV